MRRLSVGNKEKCVPFVRVERRQVKLGGKIVMKSVVKVLWRSLLQWAVFETSALSLCVCPDVRGPARFLVLSYLLYDILCLLLTAAVLRAPC